MRWIIAVLLIIIIGLQIRLWFGSGSQAELYQLKKKIAEQETANETLKAHNKKMIRHIIALREDDDAMIERAREELGMIGINETFYMLVPSTQTDVTLSEN